MTPTEKLEWWIILMVDWCHYFWTIMQLLVPLTTAEPNESGLNHHPTPPPQTLGISNQ